MMAADGGSMRWAANVAKVRRWAIFSEASVENQEDRSKLSRTKRIARAASLSTVAAAFVGFLAGVILCRYQTYTAAVAWRSALAVDTRFHAPEVQLHPGYYWIAAPHAPMWLDIAVTKAGILRKISIFRAASRGDSSVTFDYFPTSKLGVPQAWLITGAIGSLHPRCWFNVGLRRHFLIKSRSNGRSYTKINGHWVLFRRISGNTIQYEGKKYTYDKITGSWMR